MAFSWKINFGKGAKRGAMLFGISCAVLFLNSFVDVIPVEYSIYVPIVVALTGMLEKMLRNYEEFKDLPA